jgi:glutaredoxin
VTSAEKPRVTLIARGGCHLCEGVSALLQRMGIPFTTLDVDSDPDLRAAYSDEVPVVQLDGKHVDGGLIDHARLERVLRERLKRSPGRWRPW